MVKNIKGEIMNLRVLFLGLILITIIGEAKGAECTTPIIDNCTVSASMKLGNWSGSVFDGGTDGIIKLGASNIILTCENISVLGGNISNSRGLGATGNYNNVTVIGCNFSDYNYNIRVTVFNTTFKNMGLYNGESYYGLNSKNVTIQDSYIYNGEIEITNHDADIFVNNTFILNNASKTTFLWQNITNTLFQNNSVNSSVNCTQLFYLNTINCVNFTIANSVFNGVGGCNIIAEFGQSKNYKIENNTINNMLLMTITTGGVSALNDYYINNNVFRNIITSSALINIKNTNNTIISFNNFSDGKSQIAFGSYNENLQIKNNVMQNNTGNSQIYGLSASGLNYKISLNTINISDKAIYLKNISNVQVYLNNISNCAQGDNLDDYDTCIVASTNVVNINVSKNNLLYGTIGILFVQANNSQIVGNTINEMSDTERNNYIGRDIYEPRSAIFLSERYKSYWDANPITTYYGICGTNTSNATCMHNARSENIYISGNSIKSPILLRYQGTINVSHDIITGFNRTFGFTGIVDNDVFLLNASVIGCTNNYRNTGGVNTSQEYQQGASNFYIFNYSLCYNKVYAGDLGKTIYENQTRQFTTSLSNLWYPFNDVFNVSNSVVLSSNVDNFSLTLSPNQQIIIGNYSNWAFNFSFINTSYGSLVTVNVSVYDPDSLFNYTTLYLDSSNLFSSPLFNLSNGSTSVVYTLSPLSSGTYYLYLFGYDNKSNFLNSSVVSFVVHLGAAGVAASCHNPAVNIISAMSELPNWFVIFVVLLVAGLLVGVMWLAFNNNVEPDFNILVSAGIFILLAGIIFAIGIYIMGVMC